MKAKTYKSNNNFTAPESLSNFGIRISNGRENKFLGLEEFNFCSILQEFRNDKRCVAYIPCFSSIEQPSRDKIDLYYLKDPGVTIHYATLINVTQIDRAQVPEIRKKLIANGFVDHVETSTIFKQNYGQLFQLALKTWNSNFESNNIKAKMGIDRFVVNTLYEKVIFHDKKNIKDWSNFKRASILWP